MNDIFSSIIPVEGLDIVIALICVGTALVSGVVIGLIYKFTSPSPSNSLVFALMLLPVAVQTIITIVNGNLGAGVAVAGAFALVRFRSVPASAKEITLMFCDMALGIAAGTGYVFFAGFMLVIFSLIYILLSFLPVCKEDLKVKKLKVTVPEDLDYTTAFDDIFAQYTSKHILQKVKTTGLGSMYELTYEVVVGDVISEKKMIDEIRLRNGNLAVVCTLKDVNKDLF